MDWQGAIGKNREALRRILAALAAMVGLADTLPRHLHRAVLRLLRPAEAAARRLVIVMARDFPHPAVRGQSPSLEGPRGQGPDLPERRPAAGRRTGLPLFDALPRWPGRRRAAAGVPLISLPGHADRTPIAARHPRLPDDAIDARRLGQRLRALQAALDDLPAQARRFARWRARRARFTAASGAADHIGPGRGRRRRLPQRIWPLRPGRPPGWRRPGPRGRGLHEVHDILNDLHGLALWAMECGDTS